MSPKLADLVIAKLDPAELPPLDVLFASLPTGASKEALARVKEGRPIHQRDPLFAELFRYADRIETRHELTAGGVRVIETSDDAYVVQLLRAHAEVVNAFIANGHLEMMKEHPVPPR